MKGCFATLLLCYFLPMHVFRYNEAVAQILSDFCNGPPSILDLPFYIHQMREAYIRAERI